LGMIGKKQDPVHLHTKIAHAMYAFFTEVGKGVITQGQGSSEGVVKDTHEGRREGIWEGGGTRGDSKGDQSYPVFGEVLRTIERFPTFNVLYGGRDDDEWDIH
jgi:hypothetical protein